MERLSWARVILSGALPRELSDLLAVLILDVLSLQLALSSLTPFAGLSPSWTLLLLVPMICILAAKSNSPNREREELALIAYGGSSKQIELRYVLHGAIITTIGLLPILLRLLTLSLSFSTGPIIMILLVIIGSMSYAMPALRRTHSVNFVEHYKG